MSPTIRLGISTCPNDTFAFHALMHRLVDWRGIDFQVELLDIQQLNDGLNGGRFDVAKASFFAALQLSQRTVVLPSGSALGFGVGPLLLAARRGAQPTNTDQLTLCPGEATTAKLLFSLFYPQTTRVEYALFSTIMPRLEEGSADFGVCIHEGRFTWQEAGLDLVEDLGTRWEKETACPLPLGGIVAEKRLPSAIIATVQSVIRDSLEHSLANRTGALPTMRKYAQEFSDDVLMQHVDLYVNEWTRDLGETGRRALAELSRKAQSVGLVDAASPALEVFNEEAY